MSSHAIAIIACRPEPDNDELASLRQCFVTLGNHPLLLICPESLQEDVYMLEAAQSGVQLSLVRFPDHWFRSVSTYNKLMVVLIFL